jgi:hypothetical protein
MSLIVGISALGLCEHCHALISLQDLPNDSLDAIWQCPKCRKTLSHLSFGYNRGGQGAKKVKWVGPDKKWVDKLPDHDFELENYLVRVQHPHIVLI